MIKLRPVAKNCPFCAEKKDPNYKEVGTLEKYLSERGKILGKARTGLCSTHQRRLGKEIKKARHMAMLPFIVRA